nr:MAG TPA: hypothetical protein [Caudoviricetes sp.]
MSIIPRELLFPNTESNGSLSITQESDVITIAQGVRACSYVSDVVSSNFDVAVENIKMFIGSLELHIINEAAKIDNQLLYQAICGIEKINFARSMALGCMLYAGRHIGECNYSPIIDSLLESLIDFAYVSISKPRLTFDSTHPPLIRYSASDMKSDLKEVTLKAIETFNSHCLMGYIAALNVNLIKNVCITSDEKDILQVVNLEMSNSVMEQLLGLNVAMSMIYELCVYMASAEDKRSVEVFIEKTIEGIYDIKTLELATIESLAYSLRENAIYAYEGEDSIFSDIFPTDGESVQYKCYENRTDAAFPNKMVGLGRSSNLSDLSKYMVENESSLSNTTSSKLETEAQMMCSVLAHRSNGEYSIPIVNDKGELIYINRFVGFYKLEIFTSDNPFSLTTNPNQMSYNILLDSNVNPAEKTASIKLSYFTKLSKPERKS